MPGRGHRTFWSGSAMMWLAAVLWLTASLGQAQQDPILVMVNGVPIKQSEVLQRLWRLHGPSTLQEMADEILIRQAAERLKIKPNPKEVEKRMSRIREQFGDRTTFADRLRQTGTTLEEVKRQISEQWVREALVIKEKGIKVTNVELKDAFDQNKLRLGSPEQVHIRHIMVQTEEEAKYLLMAVRAGADFAKLAREKSADAASRDKGGDFGFISRGMLLPEIEAAAFALKPGEATTVKTQHGQHVLQVVRAKPAQPAEFAKVKDDLRQMLLSNKIGSVLPSYLQELRTQAKIEPQTAAAAIR